VVQRLPVRRYTQYASSSSSGRRTELCATVDRLRWPRSTADAQQRSRDNSITSLYHVTLSIDSRLGINVRLLSSFGDIGSVLVSRRTRSPDRSDDVRVRVSNCDETSMYRKSVCLWRLLSLFLYACRTLQRGDSIVVVMFIRMENSSTRSELLFPTWSEQGSDLRPPGRVWSLTSVRCNTIPEEVRRLTRARRSRLAGCPPSQYPAPC